MKSGFQMQALSQSSLFPTTIIFLIIIAVNAYLQPGFFTIDVLKSNLASFTPLILASMAQAIVVIVGGLDLSNGTTITLATVIMASLMTDSGMYNLGVILLALLAAIIVGIVNGFSIGYLRLPPIIATFATSAICFGVSLLIMPQPGGYVPPFFYQMYSDTFLFIIPVPLLLVIVALIIWSFIHKRKLYRYIYAVGGDEEASYANGIRTPLIKVLAFVISSVFLTLAAIAIISQTASGDAKIGNPYTLNSIAAVVIGGIALKGGRGNLIGAALGAMILGLIVNIIFFANISSFYQELIKGLIIIVALAISILPTLQTRKV
ncbi:MAG: ABC transporter permease [Bacilli bacterium]